MTKIKSKIQSFRLSNEPPPLQSTNWELLLQATFPFETDEQIPAIISFGKTQDPMEQTLPLSHGAVAVGPEK
jgi:hypothetical protein